jgi:Sigma-70, region 4/Anti-sigma-K factor rskA, C-terminal
MADLESLRPDQRAVIKLLVEQGKSYEEIAGLLRIGVDGVRRRAHDALAALAPEGGLRLEPARRAELSDYLLGQQTADERRTTRDRLERSPEERAWARAVADSLRSIAPGAVPEIPAGRAPRAAAADDEGPPPYATAPGGRPRGSRLGGALVLAAAGTVAAIAVILLVGGGEDNETRSGTVATNPSTQTTPTQSQTTPQPVAQINLLPPRRGSRAVGLAQVFRRGDQRAIILAAQGVSGGAYALWLYNSSSDARFLGLVPRRVARGQRFATQGLLPTGAERYRYLVVTRESLATTSRRAPSRPGPIVLQGRLNLG